MPTPEDVIQAATEFAEAIPDYTALTTPACLAQCWMHFQRVTKAAAILAAGDGWLPMESAPKDGSHILVMYEAGKWDVWYKFVTEAWWYATAGQWQSANGCQPLHKVSHWRPLPPAPQNPPLSDRGWRPNVRCTKCGKTATENRSKYCGDGSDKDNEHRWVDNDSPPAPQNPPVGGGGAG